ncbi:MAG: hypothetical protein IKX88_12425 [Thermoguttaceae bacterium]|nr:hypothetical protein [Thermoguttaceae bacterium]MBR5759390.1 hypothetical protein [Thermoguttaceae bacterium]
MNNAPLSDANTLVTGQSTLASKYGAFLTVLTATRGALVHATAGDIIDGRFLTSTRPQRRKNGVDALILSIFTVRFFGHN